MSHHKWSDIKARMSPERRARVDAEVQATLADIDAKARRRGMYLLALRIVTLIIVIACMLIISRAHGQSPMPAGYGGSCCDDRNAKRCDLDKADKLGAVCYCKLYGYGTVCR